MLNFGSFAEGFIGTHLALQEREERAQRSKLELDLLQKEQKLKEKRAQFEEQKLLEELKAKHRKEQAQSLLMDSLLSPQADTAPAAAPDPLAGMPFTAAPDADPTGGAPLAAPPNPVLQQALAPRAPQPAASTPAPQDPFSQMPLKVRQQVGYALQAGNQELANTLLKPYLPQAPKGPERLGPDDVLVDPTSGREIARGRPKAEKAPATPFAAMVAAGGDPYDVFVKLEEGRAAARAKYRKDTAGMSVTTPDGTVVQIGGPTGTGATKPLPPAEQQKFVAGAESLRLGLETLDDLTALVLKDPASFGAAADLTKDVTTALAEGRRGFAALAGMNASHIGGVQTQGAKAAELVARISTANTSRGQYLFDTLVFQQARINNPTGVLTDRDVEQAERQVGGGALKSAEDFLPKAQEMRKQFRRKHQSLQRQAETFPGLRLRPLPDETETPAPAAVPNAAPGATEDYETFKQRMFQKYGR